MWAVTLRVRRRRSNASRGLLVEAIVTTLPLVSCLLLLVLVSLRRVLGIGCPQVDLAPIDCSDSDLVDKPLCDLLFLKSDKAEALALTRIRVSHYLGSLYSSEIRLKVFSEVVFRQVVVKASNKNL